MSFQKITQIKKAQKDYRCHVCGFWIDKGCSYEKVVGVDEECRFYSYKKHGTYACEHGVTWWDLDD